jgi:Rrf2 family protein
MIYYMTKWSFSNLCSYFLIFTPKNFSMFNKETEYALQSLVYIRGQNLKKHRPGVEEIAGAIKAPRFFVAKILHRLVKTGILFSIKGKGGGFFFDKSGASVKILEIVNLIQGSKVISGCIFGLRQCSCDKPCPLHEKYSPIRDSIKNLLTTETINSLAGK